MRKLHYGFKYTVYTTIFHPIELLNKKEGGERGRGFKHRNFRYRIPIEFQVLPVEE
jgi:hypothetical protein